MRVDGAGNSQHQLNYSVVDVSPPEGWVYYRLTQVDYDSQSEVFNRFVVPVHVKLIEGSVFPNPASVGEVVHIPPNSRVYDPIGRMLLSCVNLFTPHRAGVYAIGTTILIVR